VSAAYSSAGTATRDTYKKVTLDDIRAAIEALKAPDDPLNGATGLWVHSSDQAAIDAANKIREASGNRVNVSITPNGHAGFIYGFKDKSFLPCVVIKMNGA
jgi:hypothetical protein